MHYGRHCEGAARPPCNRPRFAINVRLQVAQMAEVFTEFRMSSFLTLDLNVHSRAAAVRRLGIWQGWIDKSPLKTVKSLNTQRDNSANRTDIAYWLRAPPVYLGARCLSAPPAHRDSRDAAGSGVDGPAPTRFLYPFPSAQRPRAFSIHSLSTRRANGCCAQLAALSPWHLVNIIQAYKLTTAAQRR
jgi:hypothetical protein